MTDQLTLNEGQEFYANGQRYVIRGGVPVAEAKRGPLGGELVRADEISRVAFNDGLVYLQLISEGANDGDTRRFRYNHKDHWMAPNIINVPIDALLEINVPQPQRGRIMTAGEAAKLPDIVGKRVIVSVKLADPEIEQRDCYPLLLDGVDRWINKDALIEVLD